MKEPTLKHKFTLHTVMKLEDELNKQRAINLEMHKVLERFVNSCYVGCTREILNEMRIEAENVLKNLV